MDLMSFCNGFDLGLTLQDNFDLYMTSAKYQWANKDALIKIITNQDDWEKYLNLRKNISRRISHLENVLNYPNETQDISDADKEFLLKCLVCRVNRNTSIWYQINSFLGNHHDDQDERIDGRKVFFQILIQKNWEILINFDLRMVEQNDNPTTINQIERYFNRSLHSRDILSQYTGIKLSEIARIESSDSDRIIITINVEAKKAMYHLWESISELILSLLKGEPYNSQSPHMDSIKSQGYWLSGPTKGVFRRRKSGSFHLRKVFGVQNSILEFTIFKSNPFALSFNISNKETSARLWNYCGKMALEYLKHDGFNKMKGEELIIEGFQTIYLNGNEPIHYNPPEEGLILKIYNPHSIITYGPIEKEPISNPPKYIRHKDDFEFIIRLFFEALQTKTIYAFVYQTMDRKKRSYLARKQRGQCPNSLDKDKCPHLQGNETCSRSSYQAVENCTYPKERPSPKGNTKCPHLPERIRGLKGFYYHELTWFYYHKLRPNNQGLLNPENVEKIVTYLETKIGDRDTLHPIIQRLQQEYYHVKLTLNDLFNDAYREKDIKYFYYSILNERPVDQFFRENKKVLLEYIRESEIFKAIKENISFFQKGTVKQIAKFIADEIERGLRAKEFYLIR
jgi:hypothetical protein